MLDGNWVFAIPVAALVIFIIIICLAKFCCPEAASKVKIANDAFIPKRYDRYGRPIVVVETTENSRVPHHHREFGHHHTGFGHHHTGFGHQDTGFGHHDTGFEHHHTGFADGKFDTKF